MKRIRPDFYNEFHCIADSCTITCCQEWKIAVDPDTNRKWKKVSAPADVPEQKKNLSAYTEKKDGLRVIQLDSDHRCPFLSENRLCRLVTAYGDKILSETCTTFPREIHRFPCHIEETLMPCCPAVIDLLEQFLEEIAYKALPEDLVEKIEIDCGTLRLGDTIKVSDLDIAKNDKIELQTHLDTPIVSVVASKNVQPAEDEEETPAEEA